MSGQSLDQAAARYLVACAARKAPPGLSERLEEEWRADLMTRHGAFSRIRFGLGCCWATRIIAREFGAAAASSASGQRVLVAHWGHDFSWLSRRTVALIAIVLLHAAAFYAYLSGLTQRIVDQPAKPIHGAVILNHRTPHAPTPLPPPALAHTFVETLPTPLVTFNLPADRPAITVAPSPRPSVASALPPPANRAVGGPGAGFPDTEDYYPPAARRLGEAGAADVRVCVDANGRLTADPAIVQSSGMAQLDQGALRLAKAGSGHYRPTTENGRPVSSCYAFRIRFQLDDE